jgi:alkylation response protein AidB-like acyl-CoA dehydrogenase
MRGTGSHDLILIDVKVEEDYLVERIEPGKKSASGWMLHIPACYLGIAQAAQTYAINFAKDYSPNSINGSIIDLPNVQQKVGEMELELLRARHFLHSVAKQWDKSSEEKRNQMKPELGAVKHSVTNSAIKVVDLAMRVVGGHSLSQKSPLQRYYRDVRAGLHNPPMDDMTISLLAKRAINR